MILGIGTDIVEINRIKDAVERWGEHFLNRIFTENEIAYCRKRKDPYPCIAARFAAKEAMIKALSAGDRQMALNFKDIEIMNGPDGRPYINRKGIFMAEYTIHLTISHERSHAIATVILETSTSQKL